MGYDDIFYKSGRNSGNVLPVLSVCSQKGIVHAKGAPMPRFSILSHAGNDHTTLLLRQQTFFLAA